MAYQRKEQQPRPVTALPVLSRGRPSILLDLDEKLIKFLRAVQSKGDEINIHVDRAATIASNPSTSQHLMTFDMPPFLGAVYL